MKKKDKEESALRPCNRIFAKIGGYHQPLSVMSTHSLIW